MGTAGVERGMTAKLLRRVLLLASITTGLFAVVPTPAHACSCVPPDPASDIETADAAVVAVLVKRGEPKPEVMADGTSVINMGQDVDWTFDVERVVKGDVGRQVVVRSAASGAACGYELQVGERAGLFLSGDGDDWRGSLCSTTEPGQMAALGGKPPDREGDDEAGDKQRAAPAPPPEDDEGGGGSGGAAGAGAAAGAVALAVVGGWAIRSRRRVSRAT